MSDFVTREVYGPNDDGKQSECYDCGSACEGWLNHRPCTTPRFIPAEVLVYQTVEHYRAKFYSEVLRETIRTGAMSLENAQKVAAWEYGTVEDCLEKVG